MLDRLEQEVAYCAREVPGILPSELKPAKMSANGGGSDGKGQKSREGGESGDQSTSEDLVLLRYEETRMETSVNELDTTLKQSEEQDKREGGVAEDGGPLICMPERAALIKSILNFLKKAIPEPTFAENIRTCTSIPILHFLLIIVFYFHIVVDSSLPRSLVHIISNADYYGPSIYLPGNTILIQNFPNYSSATEFHFHYSFYL